MKGNKAFESKDYVTARLLYSQAMKIDPSQYIYPLSNAIANLKLERYACKLRRPLRYAE